jgi:Tfp pilus assembly protein FimV
MSLLLIGCKSTPPSAPAATQPTPAATYPARPTTPPAPFKLFHHANNSFTLTVN